MFLEVLCSMKFFTIYSFLTLISATSLLLSPKLVADPFYQDWIKELYDNESYHAYLKDLEKLQEKHNINTTLNEASFRQTNEAKIALTNYLSEPKSLDPVSAILYSYDETDSKKTDSIKSKLQDFLQNAKFSKEVKEEALSSIIARAIVTPSFDDQAALQMIKDLENIPGTTKASIACETLKSLINYQNFCLTTYNLTYKEHFKTQFERAVNKYNNVRKSVTDLRCDGISEEEYISYHFEARQLRPSSLSTCDGYLSDYDIRSKLQGENYIDKNNEETSSQTVTNTIRFLDHFNRREYKLRHGKLTADVTVSATDCDKLDPDFKLIKTAYKDWLASPTKKRNSVIYEIGNFGSKNCHSEVSFITSDIEVDEKTKAGKKSILIISGKAKPKGI